MTMWETWNKNYPEKFGQALRSLSYGRSRAGAGGEVKVDEKPQSPSEQYLTKDVRQRGQWIWFTCDRRYWHELEFLSSISQLCGATIFWISGFSGISQLNEALSKHTAALDCVYWLPQVVGGSGFILSGYVGYIHRNDIHICPAEHLLYSLLLMLNAQEKWYIPSLLSLPWHIGCMSIPPSPVFLCHDHSPAFSLELAWWNWVYNVRCFWLLHTPLGTIPKYALHLLGR